MIAGLAPARARESRIDRLILDSQMLPTVAQRIDVISRALIGTPYRGHTLIGGPHRAEHFVARDDCFDCVTFCETVLAAARSRRLDDFEVELRDIRYHNGVVAWQARNHYFSDWCESNIANGICARVTMPGCTIVDKALDWIPALGRRRVSLFAVPCVHLLANLDRLATGDIIGFLSRRPGLDYFHVGFVIIGRTNELLLRHAAQSRCRVLDQRLVRFLSLNHVRSVTVLRPLPLSTQQWCEASVADVITSNRQSSQSTREPSCKI